MYEEEYSDILALVRVIEPFLESEPHLILHLYALLVLQIEVAPSRSRWVWRVVSACISAISLAYTATHVCSVGKLLHYTGGGDDPYCPSLTGIVFSQVSDTGASTLTGLGTILEILVASSLCAC